MSDEYTPKYHLKKKKKVDMTKYYGIQGVKEKSKSPPQKQVKKRPGVDI